MPRINTESRLISAMKELQSIFIAQQNNDVSVSRAKFNDWADNWGNKTLLFQSLYSKGIPISELAKWLSPTQNQGQVRNAVVKINDISYVQSVIGANRTIEDFKKILVYSTTENNTSMINSIASGYTNAIRYWWNRQGGNQQRVVRQPRTTSPSEPTTTNGGTTEITEGVLNSLYQIIKYNHSSIQWWVDNRITSQTPSELATSWDEFLNGRLLNPSNSLLTNPYTQIQIQELGFWRSQSDSARIMLQKMSLVLLFDLNNYNRGLTFRVLNLNADFIGRFKDRFGQQNTTARIIQDLQRKESGYENKVKLTDREFRILQRIYIGRGGQETTTTQPTENLQQQDTAASTLVRNIPFTNTFGLEIEYFYTPVSKLISEGKKVGIQIIDLGYTHNVTTEWKIVSDASVTGSNGKELVSPILKGKKGLVEMRKCLNAMANAGALVNESCGLHLHFGAKDLSLQTWKNLLLNYDGFQPIIDKFLASYRRGNNKWSKNLSSVSGFRQKVKDATSFRQLQLIFLQANGVSEGQGTDYEYRSSARYYAVNLMPYAKHGTIEFRQHGANIEIDTVTAWVLFMHYLIEVSKKKELTNYSFENIQNFTPVALSTFLANRIFDLSEPSRNAVSNNSRYEDRS
jgi:hypothetical protein